MDVVKIDCAGSLERRNVNTTSAAVNGSPLWKVTPCRRLNVYSVPSSDTFQSSARSGWATKSPLMWVRPESTLDEIWNSST